MKNVYNHIPANTAEESFRYVVKNLLDEDDRKRFIHNTKNLASKSNIPNIFTHELVDHNVPVVFGGFFIDYVWDGVSIRLKPTRKGIRKATLCLSTDCNIFIVELHVYYHEIGLVRVPVKYDNLHNTMKLVITE